LEFLDICAGVGGFRFGMEAAGHTCVGYIECDPYCMKCKKVTKMKILEEKNHTMCTICGTKKRQHARFSYEAIHDTEGEWTGYDITTIDYRDIPRADCWTFGFPCQDISVAGEQKGFDGDRSSIFFAITKRLRQIKEWDTEKMPAYLFIENV